MNIREEAPTLAKVLEGLEDEKKRILYDYANKKGGFHRGRQWFGAGMRVDRGEVRGFVADAACPVAAAFGVERDVSNTGWFSAKLDERLLAAIKHIVVAGGKSEEGMEQYLKELENTDPVSLHQFVEDQYLRLENAKPTDSPDEN